MVCQLTIGTPASGPRVGPPPAGYHTTMNDLQRPHTVRRIVVTAGVVLAALIVAVAAVYAVAFLILAPLMQ
ncbi:hypothetical protein MAGR_31900 [Mycolicibacterium agri]|uniref:Uncharacterized protein n=2 Tax=Mycolicibacterium agri TaxID=36811 RepID=A0A7I9W2Y0_MYCAG|nr:hypothetical protein MAGR_31900 [Mycolicibacterium agri]